MDHNILQPYANVAWSDDIESDTRTWLQFRSEDEAILARIDHLRYELEAQINGDNPDTVYEVRAYRIKRVPAFYEALFKVFEYNSNSVGYIRIREYFERTSTGVCVGFYNLRIHREY